MNRLLDEHLEATYFPEYQSLRDQLMGLLVDDELRFAVPGNPMLGALCREMGEVEQSYVDALRAFRQDFAYRHPERAIQGDVRGLRTWFGELDRALAAALEGLTEEDVRDRLIVRGDDPDGFTVGVRQELDIYREALLIFYGKVIVYLRAMGKPVPPQWQDWIG